LERHPCILLRMGRIDARSILLGGYKPEGTLLPSSLADGRQDASASTTI